MQTIKTTTALQEACKTLANADFVTVDTEFIRETTFWPELCLIQMASDELAVLVDPLADGTRSRAVLPADGDPGVIKVFHAARQDIEIVYKLGGLVPVAAVRHAGRGDGLRLRRVDRL